MKNATNRNSAPTIQCFVQKHSPEKMNMSVAAIGIESNTEYHCMRHWIEVIL